MSLPEIIEEALHLKPQERYIVIENLVKSLNKLDNEIDDIWTKESKKRFEAYQKSEAKVLSYEQVFDK